MSISLTDGAFCIPWCSSWTGTQVWMSLSWAAHWRWWSVQKGRPFFLWNVTGHLRPAPRQRRSPVAVVCPDWLVFPVEAEIKPFHKKNELRDKIQEWMEAISVICYCVKCTSYPCSRPRFIMSLHSLGTSDINSTAFCNGQGEQI